MFTLASFIVIVFVLVIATRRSSLIRIVAFAALGAATYMTEFFGVWSALLVMFTPVIVGTLFALFNIALGFMMLSGKLGKERQWAAELMKDGDTEFIDALSQLNHTDIKEVEVLADSKKEFREIIVERADD